MNTDSIINELRETYQRSRTDEFETLGRLNLKAYIGENAGTLFDEIDNLRRQLNKARKIIENAIEVNGICDICLGIMRENDDGSWSVQHKDDCPCLDILKGGGA